MRRLRLSRSPIHGTGVFAVIDLPADLNLIEYRGRRITHAQADRAYGGSVDSGHTLLFTLNQRYIIDANVDGNRARFINHGCAPNCQAVVHEADPSGGKADRVFIQTLRKIRAGEEITYDYGIVLQQAHNAGMKKIWACRCGARGCTGTLLKPKKRRRI